MVGQLVRCRLHDDALEIIGINVPVVVLIEVQERLAHTLALQPAQHLGELRVGHTVSVSLSAQVELGPVTVPVEGDAIAGLVARIDVFERGEIHQTGIAVGEEAESDLVLGIWPREQVVEDRPVLKSDAVLLVLVGNLEKHRVLVALDLVLHALSAGIQIIHLRSQCARMIKR